jgi:Cu-Zn family superoxide dismutase
VGTSATALVAGGLAACGGGGTPSTGQQSVQVRLLDAGGRQVGTALLTSDTSNGSASGVSFHVSVDGLAPGSHPFRITDTGRCDPPDFVTAGAVLDPPGEATEAVNRVGHVAGALPDLPVGDDGKGTADFVDDLVSLDHGRPGSLLGPKGSALIVSAVAGDTTSARPAVAGAALACGVVSAEAEQSPTPSPGATPTASPTVSVSTTTQTRTVTVTRTATAAPTATPIPPTPRSTPTGVPTP